MLKERIKKAGQLLASEITGDCCLLDIPNYYNVGDFLIFSGEIDFIKNNTDKKIKYISSHNFFNKKYVKEGDLILIQGGGNFGDLWPKHQIFREKIVQDFMKHKIIMLPSTVFFQKEENLLHCKNIFSKHPNLILCARDFKTETLLRRHFPYNKIILIPDMALFMMPLNYKAKSLQEEPRILFLKRKDKELDKANYSFKENIDIKDWPAYNSFVYNIFRMLIFKINKILDKIFTSKSLDEDGVIKIHSMNKLIKNGINLLKPYDLIISTRLHGFVLSYLLKKPCILVDNSYGKNSTFFETWFAKINHEESDYFFVSNQADLDEKIEYILKKRTVKK